MNNERLQLELSVLRNYLDPRWIYYQNGNNGEWIYLFAPKGGQNDPSKNFTLHISLEQYPYVPPAVYVDRMLYTRNGIALSGPSREFHTLQSSNGMTRICHYYPPDWTTTESIWMVYLRCSLWLEAYLAHLDTGHPMDHWLAHADAKAR